MRMVPTDTVVLSGIGGEDLWAHAHPQDIMEELAYITRRAFVPKLVVQIYNQSPALLLLGPPEMRLAKNPEARASAMFGDLSKWNDALCDKSREREIFEHEIKTAQAEHRREFGVPDIASDLKLARASPNSGPDSRAPIAPSMKWVGEDGAFTL